MCKERRALNAVGVFLEHVDEQTANDLALGFGVADAVKFAQKQLGFVGMDHFEVHMVAEHADNLFGLVQAQQTVVNENAGQLIANRFVQQCGSDRRINAAGQRTDHMGVAHLFPDRFDRLFAVGAHGPVTGEPSDAHEVFIKLRAVGRVMHLGVELHGVEVARNIRRDRKRRVRRGAINRKSRSDFRDMVAVAHPDLFFVGGEPALKQGKLAFGLHIGAAELGGAMPAGHFAAQLRHHGLLAITDAKHRHAHLEDDCGARGDPSRVTLSGPPDRITALGAKSAKNASVTF